MEMDDVTARSRLPFWSCCGTSGCAIRPVTRNENKTDNRVIFFIVRWVLECLLLSFSARTPYSV